MVSKRFALRWGWMLCNFLKEFAKGPAVIIATVLTETQIFIKEINATMANSVPRIVLAISRLSQFKRISKKPPAYIIPIMVTNNNVRIAVGSKDIAPLTAVPAIEPSPVRWKTRSIGNTPVIGPTTIAATIPAVNAAKK